MNASEQLRAITDAVPALISYFDKDHICQFANDHHRRWYGRAPEDLVGLHMSGFLGAEGYARRQPFIARVSQGEQVSFDAQVPHLDGTLRDAAIRYVPQMVDGRFEGFYILVFDVAVHRHRFHSVFHGASVAFWELDLTHVNAQLDRLRATQSDPVAALNADPGLIQDLSRGVRIVDGNDKAVALFGQSRETLAELTLAQLGVAASQPAFAAFFSAYFSGQPGFEAETVLAASDGERLDVHLTCAFPIHAISRDTAVLGVTDIRARVARERELARVQADLAHASRIATLGELMASIAHEVNQPLSAVVNNANAARRWLQRATPDVEEAKLAIESIIEEGTRASEIIARTRSMAIKGESIRAAFPLNDMIEETVTLVRRQLSGLGAELRLELRPDLPAVVGDRIQLQQVLINLVVNAAQAMAEQADPLRVVTLGSRSQDGACVVEVQDTGPGVAPDRANQLFNAFYTTKPTGMGMGLSVAKTIVEAHGGAIVIAPNHPKGAIFRFTVPVEA